MKKCILFTFVLLAALLCSATTANAQTRTVKGVVTDEQNLPLIQASVKIVSLENSKTKATVTDLKGYYSIDVPKGAVLEFAYLGYSSVKVTVGDKTTINVQLEPDTEQLGEVVVTALGIKREKKALGYSLQEVQGDEILRARETNVANALSGKVSGLQVTRSGNGPGASSKIVLRGNNSVTGLNQPLIVVDGVPMENFTGAANNDFWNPSADMGNGLSDISSDDIASLSVLKGASAAALYGSRAGNGVILITTKRGRSSDGLGITISSSVSAERIFMTPKMQMKFGQGSEGTLDVEGTSSWGPKIEGQEYEKWNGEKVKMQAFDNVDNYFGTGLNLTETVSFSQQFNKTSIYTSFTKMNDDSKIPGSKLSRLSATTRATAYFGKDDRWSMDTKVQYIRSKANNRPISGQNASNTFITMYLFPISLDIRDFKAATNPDNTMLWYGTSTQVNPYWAQKKITNQDVRDRFLMSSKLKYQFTDWLSAELRGGTDMFFTDYDDKKYAGFEKIPNSFTTRQDRFFENNFSYLISAHKDNVIGKWGGSMTFGGNLMHRRNKNLSISTSGLTVPDLFEVNNSDNKPGVSNGYSEKKINSLYGTAQLNYGGWAFLDLTFRNDWSSTMSKANRSFFYPSVSLAWVVTDMFKDLDVDVPSWITFAKLRGSFAEVGNDLSPYQLYNSYSVGQSPDNVLTAKPGSTLFDSTVRSELIKSWEFGFDARFLDSRLGIDFSWYKTNATRQLLNLPQDAMGGFKSKKINAGNIQNTGIEVMLTANPIRSNSRDGFNWDMNVNFSVNKNTIKNLYESEGEVITKYTLGGYDNLKVIAVTGGNYGEIWGTKFARVEDVNSPYYGMKILKEGRPTATSETYKIGDQQAKGLLGFTNTFSYKGFDLSFLIDARLGGDIFSGTLRTMQLAGTSNKTVINGERQEMVVEGVYRDEQGNFQPNETKISVQDYWGAVAGAGNLGIGEANIYSATNVRLRNISLSYAFSKNQLKKTPFTKFKLGVSCNNVFMISSHMNGLDPESIFATSTNATGFEFGSSPTSRTFLFNITFGF